MCAPSQIILVVAKVFCIGYSAKEYACNSNPIVYMTHFRGFPFLLNCCNVFYKMSTMFGD